MLLKFENINLNLEKIRTVTPSATCVLFLHGFTGSGSEWNELANKIDGRFNIATIDFIGHGKSDSPADEKFYKPAQIISQLNFIITESFADYWLNLDLFSSQKKLPAEKLKEIKKTKLNNNRTGLANMLKGFSTGKMEPLFDQVKYIPAKTLLISGELDEKFTMINSQIVNNFQYANHIIIKNAGHNSHLEQPSLYLTSVNNFLKKF